MKILLSLFLHVIPLLALAQSPGLQWSKQFGYPSVPDQAHKVDVDLEGNVYIIGTVYLNSQRLVRIAKYNSGGVLLWGSSYKPESKYSDAFLQDVDVDSVGNTVILVSEINYYGDEYMIMEKYNALGAKIWSVVQHPESLDIRPVALDLDKSGNIYVASSNLFYPTSPHYYVADILVQKYNKNGILSWGALYQGTGGGDDHPGDIIADNAGKCYVAASTSEKDTRSQVPSVRTTILKFGNTGSLQWKTQPSTVGSKVSGSKTLKLDAGGYLYLAGHQSVSTSSQRFFIGKYNTSGNEQFLTVRNGVEGFTLNMTVDAAGNSYVANVLKGAGKRNYNIETHKFNTAGAHLWNAIYDSGDSTYDLNADIALDASGNIYVTGQSATTKPTQFFLEKNPKAIILKYNNAGVQQWLTVYAPPKTQTDHYAAGISLALYGGGAQPLVYLAGMTLSVISGDEPQTEDWILLKYNPAIKSPKSALKSLSAVETLKTFQVSAAPNPFRGATSIRFSIPADSHITLKVYDVVGREVITLVNGFRAAGQYTIPFNADDKSARQLFYTLTASSGKGEFRQTKTLVLKE